MSWLTTVVLSVVFGVVIVGMFTRRSPKDLAGIDIALANGAVLLDVRTPNEFASGHLKGARNIPVQELNARMSELGAIDTAVVVYCASGMRSMRAQGMLEQRGYTNILDLGAKSNGAGLSGLQ